MINLLPPDEKRQIRAARANTLLIRYNIASVIALLFIVAAIGFTYFYLSNAKSSAERTISENQSRVGSYGKVQAEAQQFRSNLATAKQILDKEVTYSKVAVSVASVLPPGVILKQLTLDAQTFGTPTVLAAEAKSYEAAIALKDAFQKSPLFTDAHFQNITNSSDTTSEYPYSVNLNVTFAKGVAK